MAVHDAQYDLHVKLTRATLQVKYLNDVCI